MDWGGYVVNVVVSLEIKLDICSAGAAAACLNLRLTDDCNVSRRFCHGLFQFFRRFRPA